jgi:hypothetical protein
MITEPPRPDAPGLAPTQYARFRFLFQRSNVLTSPLLLTSAVCSEELIIRARCVRHSGFVAGITLFAHRYLIETSSMRNVVVNASLVAARN